MLPPNAFLLAAGVLSAIAAALHLAVIVGGSSWYRAVGAGEGMAARAEAGDLYPTLVTIGIAIVLASWAAFAFSGAGLLPRLPLLRPALVAITAVYLVRGLAPVLLLAAKGVLTPFWLWSSAICLGYGLVHLIGLVQGWSRLAAPA